MRRYVTSGPFFFYRTEQKNETYIPVYKIAVYMCR